MGKDAKIKAIRREARKLIAAQTDSHKRLEMVQRARQIHILKPAECLRLLRGEP